MYNEKDIYKYVIKIKNRMGDYVFNDDTYDIMIDSITTIIYHTMSCMSYEGAKTLLQFSGNLIRNYDLCL